MDSSQYLASAWASITSILDVSQQPHYYSRLSQPLLGSSGILKLQLPPQWPQRSQRRTLQLFNQVSSSWEAQVQDSSLTEMQTSVLSLHLLLFLGNAGLSGQGVSHLLKSTEHVSKWQQIKVKACILGGGKFFLLILVKYLENSQTSWKSSAVIYFLELNPDSKFHSGLKITEISTSICLTKLCYSSLGHLKH